MSYTQKQRIMDYRATFNSEHGQRTLADLMDRFWVLGPSADGAVDSSVVVFREGQRCVVLNILKILEMTPANILERRPGPVQEYFGE